MTKIRIITDSVSDIPKSLREKWAIAQIPTYVNYGGKSYADDGIELDRSAFYQIISQLKDFPTTAAPPPGIAEQVIREALDGYDHAVCIHVAGALSATLNNIKLAAQTIGTDRVTVLDSEALTMGIGWQAIIAAETAAKTGDLAATLAAANEAKTKQKLYAAIYTMDFLRRSGRVNHVIASVGSLLKIKPIITVEENGKVSDIHRIRTFKKALAKLRELLQAEGELDRIAVLHTRNEEGAQEFVASNRDLMPEDTIIVEVGPTLGTHVGIGSIGFVSVRK